MLIINVNKLINTDTQVSTRTLFCIRSLENPLTFNQYFAHFDSFKLSDWFK